MAESIEIARAYVTLVPSLKGAQEQITKELVPAAEKSAEQAGDKAGTKFSQKFGSALSSVAKGVGKTVAAGMATMMTAATAATTALINSTSELAAYGDEIDKASQKMGISAEAYQEWDAILQHSGSSISALTPSLKTLTNAAISNSEAFQELGISEEEVANLSKEELFAKVIEGLQGMEEGSERTAIATALLGKGAQELGPLLNTSAEDTEAMREEVHRLGGVLSDEAVKNAASFQDALQDMKTAVGGVKNSIIQQALPGMTALMNGFTGLVLGEEGAEEALSEGFSNMFNNISDIVFQIINVFATLFPTLLNLIVENLPKFLRMGSDIFSQIVHGILDALPQIIEILPVLIQEVLNLLIDVVTAIVEALPDIIDAIMSVLPTLLPQIITAVIALIVLLLTHITEIIHPIIEAIPEIIEAVITALLENLPLLIMGIIEFVADLVLELPSILLSIWNTIVGVFRSLWNSAVGPALEKVGSFFSNIWEGVVETFKGAANWFNEKVIQPVTNFFSNMWNGIKNAASNAWNAVKGVWQVVKDWFNNNIIQPIANFFSNMWNNLKNGGSQAWEGIKKVFTSIPEWFKNIFSNAWQKVKDVFSTGGKIFDGIKDGIVNAFKTVVNAIIRGINKVIAVPFNAINNILQKIHDINILGITPFTWVHTFQVPQIPELALGGIINRATLSIIGERGPEAIVPLDKNSKWINTVADSILKRLDVTESYKTPVKTITTESKKINTNNININVQGAEGQSEERLADIILEKLQVAITREEAVYA